MNYQGIFCYGIYLDHKKIPDYKALVGVDRWNEISNTYLIPSKVTQTSDFEVLGIKLNTVDPGYIIPLGQAHDIIVHRDSQFLEFREAMAEIQETSSPQFWLIGQIK